MDTPDGQNWGLEYLGGARPHGDFSRSGLTTVPASARGLATFLDVVRERLERTRTCTSTTTPAMSAAALLRLAGLTASARRRSTIAANGKSSLTCIPLVRNSIRVGTPNYSSKSLEPLYMGTNSAPARSPPRRPRSREYARVLRAAGGRRARAAATVLEGDRGLQPVRLPVDRRAAGLADGRAPSNAAYLPRGPQLLPPGPARNPSKKTRPLALWSSPVTARGGTHRPTAAVAMVAAARGYHKREDKPYWWGHSDRMDNPSTNGPTSVGFPRRAARGRGRLGAAIPGPGAKAPAPLRLTRGAAAR